MTDETKTNIMIIMCGFVTLMGAGTVVAIVILGNTGVRREKLIAEHMGVSRGDWLAAEKYTAKKDGMTFDGRWTLVLHNVHCKLWDGEPYSRGDLIRYVTRKNITTREYSPPVMTKDDVEKVLDEAFKMMPKERKTD